MTKKGLAALFVAVCAVGGLFAQIPQMSAGGGVIGVNGAIYSSYKSPFGVFSERDLLAGKETPSDYSEIKSTDNFNDYGAFAFFDFTYAMAEISILFGRAPYFDIISLGGFTMLDATKLGLALYGKYPFAVGRSLAIAPMLGLQYDVVLGATTSLGGSVTNGDKDKDPPTGVLLYEGKDNNGSPKLKNGTPLDLSTLAIKLGADARYSLTDQLFLDTQLMWGIHIDSTQVESWKKFMSDFKSKTVELSTFSHSATFKVGVGYRF